MATGSYLQMNGFETRIFERHNLPGRLHLGPGPIFRSLLLE